MSKLKDILLYSSILFLTVFIFHLLVKASLSNTFVLTTVTFIGFGYFFYSLYSIRPQKPKEVFLCRCNPKPSFFSRVLEFLSRKHTVVEHNITKKTAAALLKSKTQEIPKV